MPTMEEDGGGARLFLQKIAFPTLPWKMMPFVLGLTGSVSSTSKDVGTACLSLFLSHTFQKLVAWCEHSSPAVLAYSCGPTHLIPTSTFQQCWTCKHQSPPSFWGQPASPHPLSRFAGPGARAGRCVLDHGPVSVTGDRTTALPAVTEPWDPVQGACP